MIPNVGRLDRAVRFILGAILLAAGLGYFELVSPGPMATGAKYVGLALLATSALSFCPAYRLLGVSTCSRVRA